MSAGRDFAPRKQAPVEATPYELPIHETPDLSPVSDLPGNMPSIEPRLVDKVNAAIRARVDSYFADFNGQRVPIVAHETARAGVIRVEGESPSYYLRLLAIEAVKTVPGVIHIQDKIEVR